MECVLPVSHFSPPAGEVTVIIGGALDRVDCQYHIPPAIRTRTVSNTSVRLMYLLYIEIGSHNDTIDKRLIYSININYKNMIRGNFIGAAIIAIIYTIYILWNPLPIKWQMASVLVILNALTIVLLSFAFKI
jgi:hypothetical protein